jgi:uncharacterized protein (DUF433 family)
MFPRIASNPSILCGKPIICGTRISVELIVEWTKSGATRDEIVQAYPHITAEDVDEALQFAVSNPNELRALG